MQLAQQLHYFMGTEKYHKLNLTPILATDGVKFFAQEGKAFWAVDDMCINAMQLKQPFLSVRIESKDNKAKIIYEDGDCNKLKVDAYNYTDLEEGVYCFYIIDNIILLHGEY